MYIFILYVLFCSLRSDALENQIVIENETHYTSANEVKELKQKYLKLQTMMETFVQKYEEISQKLDKCTTDVAYLKDLAGKKMTSGDNDTFSQNYNYGKNTGEDSKQRRLLVPPPQTTTSIPPNHIAFSVELTQELSNLGVENSIIYDNVLLNSGGCYNENDGIFTASIPGIYVFTWTVMQEPSRYQGTELFLNGQPVSYDYTANATVYEAGSKTVILQLQTGNEVWIRTGGSTIGGNTLKAYGYNTFSGFLLYAR